MYVCPVHKIALVHIPRTGGTAMTTALAHACPHGLPDLLGEIHATAEQIASIIRHELGDDPARYRFFAGARDPWSALESRWRHARHHALTAVWPPDARLRAPWRWPRYLGQVRAYRDFAEYIEREYVDGPQVRGGGFWATFCGPLADRVEPLPFDDLAGSWRRILDAAGLPRVPLPRLNAAVLPERVRWTPELVDRVARLCPDDIRRFAFRPPAGR